MIFLETIYLIVTIIGLLLLSDGKLPSQKEKTSNFAYFLEIVLIIIWPITISFLFIMFVVLGVFTNKKEIK